MTATNFTAKPSIIIVGAGPTGLYTAMTLASVGCDVRVIDDGRRGAGWASGGMIGAAYEIIADPSSPDSVKAFARGSQQHWGTFLTAVQADYVKGAIFIGNTPQEIERLSHLCKRAPDFFTEVERVDLPAGVLGALAWSCANDVAFDPRYMLAVLRRQCEANGVAFGLGSIDRVETGEVTLSDGTTLMGDVIVVATGHAGSGLSSSVPELANLTSVKGQMLAIAGSGVSLDRVIRAGRLYLVPRGDFIVVGATSNPNDHDITLFDADSHRALLDEAILMCPSLGNGQVVESWAGLRPMTPDGLPLVGPSQKEGVLIAAGTYRNGWLLAPGIASSLMGSVLDENPPPAYLQQFAPNRFPTSPNRTKCPDK